MINERGGVMGKKLVFAVADVPDPTAAPEANRFITRENVKIITGTFSSRLCGAASEAAARHNVIYWERSCVDPRFNKRGLQECLPHRDRRHRVRLVQHRVHRKHLAPPLQHEAEPAQDRLLSARTPPTARG